MNVEKKIKELRMVLPRPSTSLGSYVPYVETEKFVYLSGVVPMKDGKVKEGKFGMSLNADNGKEIAELCALQLIANLKEAVEDLDRVKRIVRIEGYINSTEEFTEQSKILNVVSDLMVKVFGEKGKHSRIAIGVNSLPLGAAMEVSAIVEI